MQVMSLPKEKATAMLERDQFEMTKIASTMKLGAKSQSAVIALAVREWLGRNPQVAKAYKLINQED